MINATNGSDHDLLVLGGGLAGLSLALQCRQEVPGARIAILEKNSHPVPESAFKVGESTVEVAAYYFAKVLGLEQHLVDEQLPKNGLRFFFGAGDNSAIDRRLEVGGSEFPPTPSYQLDRGRLENYLAERCRTRDIQFIDGATINDIDLARGRAAHQVAFVRDGVEHSVSSRWIADASGRSGLLKRQLGLAEASPHKANAAWFRVKARISVDDWSTDPKWQQHCQNPGERWLSTNHLLGEGYWVWLIPLAPGSTSIGIVADPALHPLSEFNSRPKALEWLKRHEPQCAEKIGLHEGAIQDFLAIKDYAMQCRQVFSSRRWGIVGDAGFFHDPFYSPGSDFIAFANTFLCELIRRDLNGRSNLLQAPIFDRLYKTLYHETMTVFQDQYHLFGNHQVMPVKILWDWMIYWTLTGFNFMHGRTCRPAVYVRHCFKLKKFSQLNRFMQQFFRDWHEQGPSHEVSGCVDTSALSVIVETNRALQDKLDDRQYAQRFAENVEQIETLFWEIIDHAPVKCTVPFKRRRSRRALKGSFQHIFDVTGQGLEGAPHTEQPQKPTIGSSPDVPNFV